MGSSGVVCLEYLIINLILNRWPIFYFLYFKNKNNKHVTSHSVQCCPSNIVQTEGYEKGIKCICVCYAIHCVKDFKKYIYISIIFLKNKTTDCPQVLKQKLNHYIKKCIYR